MPADLHSLLGVLYPEGDALALVAPAVNRPDQSFITDLRLWEADPTGLPQYFTPRAPLWASQTHVHRPGLVGARAGLQSHQHAREKAEWPQVHDVVWIEVDYLLYRDPKDFDYAARGLDPGQVKALQRDAIWWAAQMSGLPYSFAVDSGGKSIHFCVVLSDPAETQALRGEEHGHLLDVLAEALGLALGEFDTQVLRSAGRHGLVRTPGARRDNGAVQTILGVERRRTLREVLDWCYAQLSPAVAQEVRSRPPVSPMRSAWARHPWRLDKGPGGWADLLLRPMTQGGHPLSPDIAGLDDWCFRVNSELAKAGQREPRCLERPSQAVPAGRWDASFLFFVQACVMHAMTAFGGYPGGGWFFTQNPDAEGGWACGRRTKWPVADLQAKVEARQARRDSDALVDAWLEQAPAFAQRLRDGTCRPPPLPGHKSRGPWKVKKCRVPPAGARIDPDASAGGIVGGRFDPPRYADAILAAWNVPVVFLASVVGDKTQPWWRFDGKCWHPFPVEKVESLVGAFIEASPPVDQEGVPQAIKDAHVQEVVRALRRRCVKDDMWQERADAVAFQNGTLYMDLDVGGLSFVPRHDPDDMLRSVLPYDYDPAARPHVFGSFLEDLFEDPVEQELVMQYIGYCLFPVRLTKDFLIMWGESDTGKSTLLNIITEVVGRSNALSFDLNGLHGDFSLDGMEGKKIIYDPEVNTTSTRRGGTDWTAVANRLKAMTGGDVVRVNAKCVRQWNAEIVGKVLLASNERPEFRDGSAATWNRLIGLPVTNVIPKERQDPRLIEKVRAELPGVANRAIEAFGRFLSRRDGSGSNAYQFVQSERMLRAGQEYRADMDSVISFLEEYLEPDPTVQYLHIDYIYKAYEHWCEKVERCGAVKRKKFIARLQSDKHWWQHFVRPYRSQVTREMVLGWPPHQEFPPYDGRDDKKLYWLMRGYRCTMRGPAMPPLLESGDGPRPVIQFPARAAR
jgi:P4 family phage/plasmid primase-like protien